MLLLYLRVCAPLQILEKINFVEIEKFSVAKNDSYWLILFWYKYLRKSILLQKRNFLLPKMTVVGGLFFKIKKFSLLSAKKRFWFDI